jgi:hypothetical protein
MKIIISLCLCLISLLCFSQQNDKQQSRFLKLDSLYKFSSQELKILDSLKSPQVGCESIQSSVTKILKKEGLLITQDIFPVSAEITQDTFGGYLEVITYKIISKIVSEKHKQGSLKEYNEKVKLYKQQFAARLREQAAKIEKE